MKKVIGLLDTFESPEEIRAAIMWLQQFGNVRTVTADERAGERHLDVLVIPSGNFVDGASKGVIRENTLCPLTSKAVSATATMFRDITLESYVEKNTPILAVGASADMLWLKQGNKVSLTPNLMEEESDELIIALTTNSMNVPVPVTDDNHVGREGFAFFKGRLPNNSTWINEKKTTEISWITYLRKEQILSSVKNVAKSEIYTAVLSKTNHIAGFYDQVKGIVGIKNVPYKIYNSMSSLEFRKFSKHLGDPVSNALLRQLLSVYDQ